MVTIVVLLMLVLDGLGCCASASVIASVDLFVAQRLLQLLCFCCCSYRMLRAGRMTRMLYNVPQDDNEMR